MKRCSICNKYYPDTCKECPFCRAQKKNVIKNKNNFDKKYIFCSIAAVAWVCIIAIIITSIFNYSNTKPVFVNSSYGEETSNSADIKDNVKIIENDRSLEKGLEEITYSKDNNEYTIRYKKTPETLKSLQKGDLFLIPANEEADNYNFAVGFSGKITEVQDDYISFVVPLFDDIFDYFSIDASSIKTSNVIFMPNDGVELESLVPNNTNTASIGINKAQTDKISLGDFSAETTYKEADTVSQLEGYDLLAKKLSLKINKKAKTTDETDIEISGKVTLNYPAVKFNMTYDSENENLENYDVGLITNQSVDLKIKGTDNIGMDDIGDYIGEYGIIDLKDVSNIEHGKIVLGSYFIGYQIPILCNVKNQTPVIGVGLVFQICLTANGKIEIECDASESGLLRVETNSNGKSIYELKNSNCPNPVLGEQIYEGENFDDVSMKSTAKGSVDFNAAISVDIGFSVLGTIPIKLSNDVINFELITSFEKEEHSKLKFDIAEDMQIRNFDSVSFYQFKTQSVIKINIGAAFKIAGKKYDIGEFGYQNTLWNKVWLQYPKPIEFSKAECNFGGIQLGESYSIEDINMIFYSQNEKTGKSNLGGKIKDRFLQSTTRNIVNKINYNVEDIMDFRPIEGNYDITCFSEGAIYFMEDGIVKAELITGDEVYNSSYVSHSSNDEFIRSVYSEPHEQHSITINIGEIGKMILNKIGMDELTQYDGTNLTIYKYTSDDNANMEVYLDGNGNVIFIIVY